VRLVTVVSVVAVVPVVAVEVMIEPLSMVRFASFEATDHDARRHLSKRT